MGLRETMNEKPALTAGIVIAVIVIFIGLIIYSMSGGSSSGTAEPLSARKHFFTDDDGAHYFTDSADKVAPIDHNGKQAVRARVFKAGGKEFVNHLERYTPEGKKKMEDALTKGVAGNDPTIMESIQRNGLEVKAPGAKDWVKLSDPRSMEVMRPKVPSGANPDDLEEINP